jgi:kynurenine formamidase
LAEHELPSKADVHSYIHEKNNWGRWGQDDQVGAVNLVTDAKRLQAVSLVRKGRVVSLSRELPKTPAPNNLNPAQHFMRTNPRAGGGSVTDYYGTSYHGQSTTHLDALCHIWVGDYLWNGRKPGDVIGFDGAHWGAIQNWSNGIITRGVLLDVPSYRGEPYVTQDKPVHGWELEDVARKQSVKLEPGDAVVVYSGRDAWNRDETNSTWGSAGKPRPGLHASCLPFLHDNDVSILVWDMMDCEPNDYDLPWQVHPAIAAYGIGLVDNALLEPLAAVCSEERRYEFMLILAPLIVIGGTGSPLNPLAMF